MYQIYALKNTTNSKLYIGSAGNAELRYKRHLRSLENGTHHNLRLQEDFKLLGNVLELIILEEVSTRAYAYILEDSYMSQFKTKEIGYNIADARFGDTITHHPRRDSIIRQIRQTLVANYNQMTVEERAYKYGRSGNRNGNWNPTIVRTCCVCGAPLSKRGRDRRRDTCRLCLDTSGVNNPFFGKTHSDETKRKLSERFKGTKRPEISKPVSVEGVIYPSRVDAAEAIGCTVSTITNRCRNDNFPTYQFINVERPSKGNQSEKPLGITE